jgi:hypothetical protein
LREVVVLPDDLAQVVNAKRCREAGGERIVDRSVRAAAVEESVGAAKVTEQPDNLARTVNPPGAGAANGQRIVECRVGIDWHGMAFSVIVPRAENVDRRAGAGIKLSLGPSRIPRAAHDASSHHVDRSGSSDPSAVALSSTSSVIGPAPRTDQARIIR